MTLAARIVVGSHSRSSERSRDALKGAALLLLASAALVKRGESMGRRRVAAASV